MTVSKTTEGEIGWLADGEKAEQTILNRPLKQFLAKYNVAIDQINADIIASSGAITNTVPINKGGTGAVTAADARASLGTNNAANLTTGTMPAERMPDIDATKTTTGVFNIARIPTIPTSKISPAVATQTDLTTAVNELTLEITRSPLPTFTGNAEFNGLSNVLKMNGLKDAMDLEIGDVLQFSNTLKNNKIHTVESFVTSDTIVSGQTNSGQSINWTGFVSFTGKAEDTIGFGYSRTIKPMKLVNEVWTTLPAASPRLWTGVAKLNNGRVFAATHDTGIYEIFEDGSDLQLTTGAQPWRALTSVGNTLYGSIYGGYIYKLDILNSSLVERNKLGPALNAAIRAYYAGIVIDGDYLYHSGDMDGIYRKNLKDSTPDVRVDTPAVNIRYSNFFNYKGDIYALRDFGATVKLDRSTNTFVNVDSLFHTPNQYIWGIGVIEDDSIFTGQGTSNEGAAGPIININCANKAGDIILNFEHSATRGNGSLKLLRETKTGVNVKLLSKWYNAPIGLGQDWVTINNKVQATYYNGLGNRDMLISIFCDNNPGAYYETGETRLTFTVDQVVSTQHTYVAKANKKYKFTGYNTISNWWEMR